MSTGTGNRTTRVVGVATLLSVGLLLAQQPVHLGHIVPDDYSAVERILRCINHSLISLDCSR